MSPASRRPAKGYSLRPTPVRAVLPEMREPPSCVLCRRRHDALVEALRHHFCAACLSALGRFVSDGPDAVVSTIWRTRAPKSSARGWVPAPGSTLTDLLAQERASQTSDPAKFEQSVEAVFVEFTKGIEGVVKPEDVETHLDLAIAYREMGLVDDAVGEAAIALRHGASLLGKRTKEAVAVIFDARAMRVGLDEALDKLRRVLFPD